jgi:hypothetical protein
MKDAKALQTLLDNIDMIHCGQFVRLKETKGRFSIWNKNTDMPILLCGKTRFSPDKNAVLLQDISDYKEQLKEHYKDKYEVIEVTSTTMQDNTMRIYRNTWRLAFSW